MKQNLLFIYPILPPYPGGAAVCGELILNELATRYKNINLITVLSEKGVRIKSNKLLEINDVLFRHISTNNKNKFKQLLNYAIIIKFVFSNKYDVIHIHSRYVYAKYLGNILMYLLRLSKKNIVIDLRDKFYQNRYFRHFQYLVCSSDLVSHYKWIENKTMIPIPIKLPPSNQYIESQSICYIGEISESKGVLELLNGYRLYYKKSKNPFNLKLYGPNKLDTELENIIEEIPSIRYEGIINYNQIPKAILSNKCVILPSKSEGMPRVALETIFYNRIIILHESIKALKKFIPNKFILSDINPKEIAKKFLLIEKIESGQIKYNYNFEQHNPPQIVNSLIKLYNAPLK